VQGQGEQSQQLTMAQGIERHQERGKPRGRDDETENIATNLKNIKIFKRRS
jgi:hypothetical protein